MLNKISYPIAESVTSEQIEYAMNALKSYFEIDHISGNDNSISIVHLKKEEAKPIGRMLKRFLFISKSLDRDLIFTNDIANQYRSDPQPQLEQVGDVVPIQPGFYSFQGDFLKVFRALNGRVKAIADQLDAIEQEYPTIWPVKLFKAIDYFNEFPHQVIMCTSVKADFETRQAFASTYAKSQDYETIKMDGLMADSEYGLEPAVCDCCYYGLAGKRQLPNNLYTCYNKVFRNERSKTNRLDRLTNFSVRDIMFVGDESFVLESRQTLIEILSEFLTDLRLCAKIETANDPFFANESAMKSVFQNTHRLKYELLAEIPHLESSLAVGSINLHLEFFGKAFDIETEQGAPAFSGCIGVGMERMAYACVLPTWTTAKALACFSSELPGAEFLNAKARSISRLGGEL